MNYAELVQAVYQKTQRPDKKELTDLALQEATYWAHTRDLWKRDLVEIPFTYSVAAFTGKISTQADLKRFRQIAYWRKFDPLTGTVGKFLTPKSPDLLTNPRFGTLEKDIYYLAGTALNWFSSTEDTGHIIGYYAFPSTLPTAYFSWIADIVPYIIVNYAAASVCRDTGFIEKAKMLREDAMNFLSELSSSDVTVQGR